MKAKIYTRQNRLPAALFRLCFTAAMVSTVSISYSQERNAHSITGNGPTSNTTGPERPVSREVKTLSVVPGVTPRDNINAIAGDNSRGRVDQGNILLNNSAAKLSAFTGRSENGKYHLTWQTVMENDVKQYDIEYSTNNEDFEAAGTVIASNRDAYTFNHTIAASPVIYYRLKIMGHNGSITYTSPLAVKSGLARPSDIVAPTIIRDNVLNITIANSYKDVRLINNAGVEVFREYLGGRTGNRIGFNLPALPAGPYYVRLMGNSGTVTEKVIIM
ncbi:MAG: T9SS type A sorting domain-containing protein [Sphingobacteriales bacterium]|nr:MAG: T9SS type A sorting domain-containing protein [Sphingobacteriales bacterium]